MNEYESCIMYTYVEANKDCGRSTSNLLELCMLIKLRHPDWKENGGYIRKDEVTTAYVEDIDVGTALYERDSLEGRIKALEENK